jgi:enterochelin esterase-like enzyme
MSEALAGTLKRYADFESRFVAARNVDVWLPPGYVPARPRPVIYVHDGQNLFNPETAYGGVDWGIVDAMIHLVQEGGIEPAIVVGMWNTERRFLEYMPAKPLERVGRMGVKARFVEEHGGLPLSDRYLRFVVEEVKPWVDATYGTRPGRESTFMMGSSMGGLVSLYGLCECPGVFGGAACLSTHWPAAEGVTVGYLRRALPAPGEHRIYFDYGTETLDALYEPYQEEVDRIMRDRGYEEGRDWVTRRFEGAEHSERAWRRRVGIPLEFLLTP